MKNVKRILLLTCLSLGAGYKSLHAQVVTKGSHHFFLGYTFPNYIADFVSTRLGGSFVGPITAAYQYGLFKRVAVGVQLGYSTGSTGKLIWTDKQGPHSYGLGYNVFIVNVKADYHYLKSKKWDLYSGFTAGYAKASAWLIGDIDLGTRSISSMVWGINAIGCRYMFTKQLGGYGEIGYNVLGLANVGVSARLGK